MGFGKGPSTQSPTAWQRTKLAIAAGANLVGYSTGTTYDAGTIGEYLKSYVASLAASGGATLVSWIQSGVGAVARTVQARLRETVSVMDFGAIGTAAGAGSNEATDTAAFLAAQVVAKRVIVPEGTFYLSATYEIDPGCSLEGAGAGRTIIYYSGTGNGIYMGAPGNTTLAYLCKLKGITLICTNRASTVNGVYGDNLVHFDIEDVTTVGSGNPNSANPTDNTLYGTGFLLTNNSIIGRMSRCSGRIWEKGAYLKTLSGSQSYWTAAIVIDGQCEFSSNMRGIVVGDPTIGFYSGVGVSLRDVTLQGNYTTGMNVYSGDNTCIENCYFEGNANYDIAIGTPAGAPTPIGVKIKHCTMNAEDIGTTNYGTFPYIAKIYVDRGTFTTIRDNNMSISTSIPLISLAADADTTNISGNRLNSAIAVSGRILDNGTNTITADNYPEKARCAVGQVTRLLNAATATVAYTGLGFKPTSIEFFCAVDTVNDKSVGGAALTDSGYLNRCITTDSAGAQLSSNNCIRIIRSSAGNEQKAVLHSFDADGFSLDWTLVGTPPGNTLVVNYIARR